MSFNASHKAVWTWDGAKPTTPGGHHKKKHPAPPKNIGRAPIQAGVIVAFGPHDPSDDPTLPDNTIITSKFALPLTPGSMSVAAAANWTDGIYPVRGDEHGVYGGAQLETITFSGRLEPPAFYVSSSTARDYIQDMLGGSLASGQWSKPGAVDVEAEALIQKAYYGSYFSAPPGLYPGTDVVMQDGAVAPPGYEWHEPHDITMLLRQACKNGEIVRLIIGDQYGYNELISIRSFTWRVEDGDPDVINFDISCRQHRSNELASGPTKHKKSNVPRSYTTRNGDTLQTIASTVLGDPGEWRKIVEMNRRLLERQWRYGDNRADGTEFYPPTESIGPIVRNHPGGTQVGVIRHIGQGVFPMEYLRADIKLVMSHASHPRSSHHG